MATPHKNITYYPYELPYMSHQQNTLTLTIIFTDFRYTNFTSDLKLKICYIYIIYIATIICTSTKYASFTTTKSLTLDRVHELEFSG